MIFSAYKRKKPGALFDSIQVAGETNSLEEMDSNSQFTFGTSAHDLNRIGG